MRFYTHGVLRQRTGLLLAGLVLMALMAPAAWAETACPPGLAARVQQNYQAIKGFEANFTQTDQRLNGPGSRAQGTVAYLKPGRMRWEYMPPEEQLLVTNGETVWLFDPLLENVTVQPLKGMAQGTPLAFLLGMGNLVEDFTCRPHTIPAPKDDLRYMELLPRKKVPGLAFVQLGVTPSGQMAALLMVDSQGGVRTVRLKNMQIKTRFPKEFFRFNIPAGMEVISR